MHFLSPGRKPGDAGVFIGWSGVSSSAAIGLNIYDVMRDFSGVFPPGWCVIGGGRFANLLYMCYRPVLVMSPHVTCWKAPDVLPILCPA